MDGAMDYFDQHLGHTLHLATPSHRVHSAFISKPSEKRTPSPSHFLTLVSKLQCEKAYGENSHSHFFSPHSPPPKIQSRDESRPPLVSGLHRAEEAEKSGKGSDHTGARNEIR